APFAEIASGAQPSSALVTATCGHGCTPATAGRPAMADTRKTVAAAICPTGVIPTAAARAPRERTMRITSAAYKAAPATYSVTVATRTGAGRFSTSATMPSNEPQVSRHRTGNAHRGRAFDTLKSGITWYETPTRTRPNHPPTASRILGASRASGSCSVPVFSDTASTAPMMGTASRHARGTATYAATTFQRVARHMTVPA